MHCSECSCLSIETTFGRAGFSLLICGVPSCRLIAEYIEAAPTSAVEDAVQTLSGVNLLRMAHTREGAGAACAVLAYGTAKDRKQAVKAMQGASARRFCGTWQRCHTQRRHSQTEPLDAGSRSFKRQQPENLLNVNSCRLGSLTPQGMPRRWRATNGRTWC